ncbi:MAG: transporter substrate-binding domain-containing protein [Treponema sp.]|nr:transporter substrate-binding domain-containing protein [Treponema sp.]
MKYIIKIAIIFSLITIALTGCPGKSNDLTIKKDILLVGVNVGYPPMEYLADDGVTFVGFNVSLAKAIGEKLGLEVQFIDTFWEVIFDGLNNEKYDCIISSVTITAQRQQNFNFSNPYLQNTLAIVMLNDSEHTVNSPSDLGGLRVAYQAETTSSDLIDQLIQEGKRITPFEFDNVMYCFDDLSLGRVHAVVTDLVVGIEYLTRSESFNIVWQGEEEVFGICVKKGNDTLTEAINKALFELFEDGTILRLSKEFFKERDLVSMVKPRQ